MDSYHQELLKELPSLGNWHHQIDLGDGITTNPQGTAYNPEDRWRMIEPYLPTDLAGKTVLDLGCNSGYMSMKMKKRGASKVVAVDSSSQWIRQTQFVAKWFNVDIESVHEEAHVYCLTTSERFDYVIFLGLFYHLKYGTIVLDRLAEMTKEKLFFQTEIYGQSNTKFEVPDNLTWEDKSTLSTNPDFPRMLFLEKYYNNDWSNWWICNEAAVMALLRSSGLKIIERPGADFFVCEHEKVYGKKVYDKPLVFPMYGKGDDFLPGSDGP